MRRDAESTANGKSTLIIAGACETDFVLLRDGSRSQAKGSNKKSGSVGALLRRAMQPGSRRESLQAGQGPFWV